MSDPDQRWLPPGSGMAATSDLAPSRWPLRWVLLATLCVLAPGLLGDYVDDDLDILGRSPVFFGLSHLWDAIRAPFWGTDAAYWRPLTSGLLCIGHALGGGQPWLIHAMVLAAHLAATALAAKVLRRLGAAPLPAVLAAGLFALHPCQVEGVAWVAAAADPLAGCAVLLTLDAWLRWRQRPDRRLPWGAWLGFAAALACKETGIVALALVFAIEWGSRGSARPARWRLAVAALPCVAFGWLALRVVVYGDFGAGFDRGHVDLGVHGVHALLLRAHVELGLAMLPSGWLGATPFRWIPPAAGGLLIAFLPLLLLAGSFAAATVRVARTRRLIAWVGGVAVAASVAPQAVATQCLGPWPLVDRYAYVATFGFAAVLLGGGQCRTWIAVTLVTLCAALSGRQVTRWRTHADVVAQAVSTCPQHPEASLLVGGLELQRAQAELPGPEHEAERVWHCRNAYVAYRTSIALMQRPVHAALTLHDVVQVPAEVGVGVVALAGNLLPIEQVRTEMAALAVREPNSAPVQVVLGLAAVTAGDAAAAETAWQRALQLDAGSDQAAFNLGRLFAMQGRREAARTMLEHALTINPGNQAAASLLAQLSR